MIIDGACHCGLIKYEAEIDPEKVRVCHCTDCQSLTGSAFRVVVPVPADKFSLSGDSTVCCENDGKRSKARPDFLPQMRIADLRSARGCARRIVFH
jgi:hypothetical protein